MSPSDGDMLITWLLPDDEGTLRLRLCADHLRAVLCLATWRMMDR